MSRLAAQVMMGATLLAGVAGLLAHGPIALAGNGHRFADALTRLGIPHAANVLSHMPLLAVALAAALACGRRSHDAPPLRAWTLFFALVALSAVAGSLYHARPGDERFLFVHALIGSASCVLSLIFVSERLTVSIERMWPLALAALAGPAVWVFGAGVQDLRWMLALQCLPVVLMPLVVWGLPSRGLPGSDWLVALGLYALAECASVADPAIWEATRGGIGGMALSHVLLAACIGWLARSAVDSAAMTPTAQPTAAPDDSPARSAECSSRATSATTAG